MNIPQIITDDMKQLLNKYYEGLTTEQEEQTLKDWLLSEDVPIRGNQRTGTAWGIL